MSTSANLRSALNSAAREQLGQPSNEAAAVPASTRLLHEDRVRLPVRQAQMCSDLKLSDTAKWNLVHSQRVCSMLHTLRARLVFNRVVLPLA